MEQSSETPPTSRFSQIVNNDLAIIWASILIAWMLTILAAATGQEHWLHQSALIKLDPIPLIFKLLLFLSAWQVMTAAMMLPSSLPMMRLFIKVSRQQTKPQLALLAFVGAYAAVWTGFAISALLLDIGLHSLVPHWHWLAHRPWLIAGTTLILAGAFQFSSLKEQCLTSCRHPLSFLTHHYQRGLKAAWDLGIRHGLYCLGCCWALMLVMLAVGVGHFTWMIVLTVIMTLERTWKQGQKLVPVVGVTFLVWGGLVLFNPGWLPDLLGGYGGH